MAESAERDERGFGGVAPMKLYTKMSMNKIQDMLTQMHSRILGECQQYTDSQLSGMKPVDNSDDVAGAQILIAVLQTDLSAMSRDLKAALDRVLTLEGQVRSLVKAVGIPAAQTTVRCLGCGALVPV